LEVGVGGRYDSTNIVPRPIVTGITALGIDHVGVLGKTLPEIAWQKAGIYKASRSIVLRPSIQLIHLQADVPALTVEQPEEALRVLREQATEVKVGQDTAAQIHCSNQPVGFQVRGRSCCFRSDHSPSWYTLCSIAGILQHLTNEQASQERTRSRMQA
jgi:folylpolyglutamate synthase/dihydropteroate synthase